ncbi:unnamed protein product [Sphagnum balticum]
MPIANLRVTESSTHIIETVSEQISKQVLNMLGFSHYFKDSFYLRSEYMGGNIATDRNRDINLTRDRCDVRYDPNLGLTDHKWEALTFKHTQAYGVSIHDKNAFKPVFHDRDAAVQMTEHIVPCSTILNFSVKFKNREDATLMMTSINNASMGSSVLHPHDIAYDYPLDIKMATALYAIWKMRTSINQTIDFFPYLQKCSNQKISYIESKDQSLKEYVIKRANLKCMGVLECNMRFPDVVKNDDYPDLFVVEFTYTIQFDRPDSVRLYLPVTVENQIVPPFIVKNDQTTFYPKLIGLFQEMSLYSILREFDTVREPLVQLPNYDDWIVPTGYQDRNKYNPFFISAFTLDEGTTQIDLNHLGEYVLHPIVIAIMKVLGPSILLTQTIFRVSIFANDKQLDPSLITIDNNLVINMNLTNTLRRYHVVISEINDIGYLDPKWIPTVLQYRTFFPITIIKNLQYLIDRGYCYVDTSNAVLNLIQRAIRNGYIDTQISALIAAGHVNEQMYAYATTVEQLAEYMLHTFSPVTKARLFDEYVNLSVQMGLIAESDLPSGYVVTSRGYPFLSNNAISSASGPLFNTPLRVESVTISARK